MTPSCFSSALSSARPNTSPAFILDISETLPETNQSLLPVVLNPLEQSSLSSETTFSLLSIIILQVNWIPSTLS